MNNKYKTGYEDVQLDIVREKSKISCFIFIIHYNVIIYLSLYIKIHLHKTRLKINLKINLKTNLVFYYGGYY